MFMSFNKSVVQSIAAFADCSEPWRKSRTEINMSHIFGGVLGPLSSFCNRKSLFPTLPICNRLFSVR